MADAADRAWIEASARLQRIAASRTRRTDLVVRFAPELERDATAWSGWYHHGLAEIRLPAGELLGAPEVVERIDLTTEAGRHGQPKLAGALCLASAHAAHTTWARNDQEDAALAPFVDLLERIRVAARLIAERPSDRRWLRAVAPPLTEGPPIWKSVAVVGLQWAEVVTAEEARAARERLIATSGSTRVAQLEELVRSALLLADGAADELRELARRVASLFGLSAGGRGADDEPSPEVQASIDAVGHVTEPSPRSLRSILPREDDLAIAERELARAAAAQTFGDRTAQVDVTSRDPDTQLRRSARELAGVLRRARYRAGDTSLVASAAPPGRLRLAEAMRREAQRAAGVPLTARPWLQLRRRVTNEPPLRVGLSWDISRSQSPLHGRMADLAWALAWAMQHIDGSMAAVAWNSTAHPVHWPGRIPEAVVEPGCSGTSAGCPQSLRALEGALDLQTPAGARMIVITTDGRVPNRRMIHTEINRLVRCGVTILWVTPVPDPKPPVDAISVVLTDPDNLVKTLGDVIRRVLART